MNLKDLSDYKYIELTSEEANQINGGNQPDKTTSFWHDLSYYVTHGLGHLAKAMEKEGMFTKSYWEDFSIDLSS